MRPGCRLFSPSILNPLRQLILSHPVSSGFENSTYNSLNAFRFINAKGAVVSVRWSMVPAQPFEPISTADPGQADKNYLFDALIASIHNNPLQWHLVNSKRLPKIYTRELVDVIFEPPYCAIGDVGG